MTPSMNSPYVPHAMGKSRILTYNSNRVWNNTNNNIIGTATASISKGQTVNVSMTGTYSLAPGSTPPSSSTQPTKSEADMYY